MSACFSRAARMMLRPMRPNPLIPTLIATNAPIRDGSWARKPGDLIEARRPRPPVGAAGPAPVAGSSHAGPRSAHEDSCSGLFFGGMYLLYNVLSVVALVIASPFLAYQAVRHRNYVRSLRQRLRDPPRWL